MCGDSATGNTNVTVGGLSSSLLNAKQEKIKERQDKLAKTLSKINVPRRKQPLRDAAALAAAVSAVMTSDDDLSSDSSVCSDLDSVGSGASYDVENELFTDATDSDFHDGLIGEDKKAYQKTHRRKKVFWLIQGRQQFLYYKDVNQTIGHHKNVKL